VRPEDNTASVSQQVVGSFDPNEKSVTPEGTIESSQVLRYHIDFQNVGTFYGYGIVIRDTLETDLAVESIVFGATSHQAVLTRDGR
jgi:hypothetical protein